MKTGLLILQLKNQVCEIWDPIRHLSRTDYIKNVILDPRPSLDMGHPIYVDLTSTHDVQVLKLAISTILRI